MTAVRVLASRLWGSLFRQRTEAALAEEIQTHLDLLTEEFETKGLPRAQARLAARREFGGVAFNKEAAREARGFPFIESLAQDARFAIRQLRRSPSFAIAAVLTLAIGIGATTAVFSVLDIVARRPLAYPDAGRLVAIQESLPQFGPFPVSVADAEFWGLNSSSFDAIALATGAGFNLTGAGEPERVIAGMVQPAFLRMLGADTQIGRLFLDTEDQPGRDRIIVLGDTAWRRRFNADPAIVGRTIELDGVVHEVVGVLSPRFKAPNIKLLHSLPTRELMPEMWKPLALTADQRPAIGGYSYASLARLKPGVSVAQAGSELSSVQAELVRRVPGKGDLRAVVVPLQEQMASRSRAGLELLLLAVATVLVIGCVNVVNLLLARTIARGKEVSVREAVGAGRRRIARQMMVENLLLAACGGIAGVAVAYATLGAIVALAPGDVPRLDEVRVDVRMLWFIGGVSVVCGLIVGLAPAWQAGRHDLHTTLKERVETAVRPVALRFRSALVAGEIGLSAAAVAVAALLLQTFAGLLTAETGFSAAQLLTTDINLAGSRYQASLDRVTFIDSVAADLQQSPGVQQVAVATQLPLTGTGSLSALSVEGTTATAADRPSADVRSVSPEYFPAMALTLRSGRLLEAADRERSVAVLSAELAARGWPGRDPLGQRFRFGMNPAATVFEVVGTVGDVRGLALDQPLTPTAYVPFPQRSGGGLSLIVKASGEPSRLAPRVRQVLRAHDPQLPIGAFRTMGEVMTLSLESRRFQLQLVALFALLAALLAGLGVYGVIAYSVAQRTGEIGIRLALGARPGAVLGMVLRDALRLTGVGLLVAAPLTLLAGSFLRTFLVGITPRDPVALGGAAIVVALTALAAASVPAFRASRVDPMTALRNE